MRKLTDLEALDAEREFQLFNEPRKDSPPNEREAFMAGLQFQLGMADKARAREVFEQERFKRAWILARQMSAVSAQTILVLNNVRKRLIIGPDQKPVDTLGIGKTIETVASALKSAEKVLEILKVVQPDGNGNPILPKLPEAGGN